MKQFAHRHPVLVWWLIVGLPLVCGLVAVVGTHWYPTGDMAQAELHVRGLWRHPPLVGAAGRIESDGGVQGSHPGPALWVSLWPVYALFGRTSLGLLVSAIVVHLGTIGGVLWLSWRRGGRLFVGCVAVCLLIVVRASGPAAFLEPWNPWFAVIPYAAFILMCWSALVASPRWLLAAVAAGSYCIQCHTGYLVVVSALLGVTTGRLLWDRRAAGLVHGIRTVIGAIGIGCVAWIAPIVDQLRRTPGNLSILWQHFGSPDQPTLPISTAGRIVASELSILGPWMTGPSLISRNAPGVVMLVALWGVAWQRSRSGCHPDDSVDSVNADVSAASGLSDSESVAAYQGDVTPASADAASADSATLHGLLAVSVLAGAVSVLRIFGGFQEYTIRWFWVLTALIVARSAADLIGANVINATSIAADPTAADSTVRDSTVRESTVRESTVRESTAGESTAADSINVDSIGHRHSDRERLLVRSVLTNATRWAGVIALAALTGLTTVQFATRADTSKVIDSRYMSELVDDVGSALDPAGRYLVRWHDPVGLGALPFGLVLEMERQGLVMGVDQQFAAAALPHRVMPEETATELVWVVSGERIDDFRVRPEMREIASADLRSADQQARSAELRRRLKARFDEIGTPDQYDLIDVQYGAVSLMFHTPAFPPDIAADIRELVGLRMPVVVFAAPPGTPAPV